MAERRMFAKQIIDSDAFLDMPLSTQSLYFHLSMRADDDGFLNNCKKIQRMLGCSDDDLKILFAKNFLIPFENGVCVVKHWRIHNYIQRDRYKETVYTEEKKNLSLKNNGVYTLDTECIQDDDSLESQVRLGKVRLGKDSKDITPRALLEAESIPENLINDWLKIRKAKRVVLTDSVISATKREAEKAGITFLQAVQCCCENSWAGFKAEYLQNKNKSTNAQREQGRHIAANSIFKDENIGHLQGEKEITEVDYEPIRAIAS